METEIFPLKEVVGIRTVTEVAVIAVIVAMTPFTFTRVAPVRFVPVIVIKAFRAAVVIDGVPTPVDLNPVIVGAGTEAT